MRKHTAAMTGDDPLPPRAPAWDSIVERAEAAERRGFLALAAGGGLAAVGSFCVLYQLVRPGPAPLLAELCRGDTLAVRSVDMPAGRPALEDIAEDLRHWVRGAREVSFDLDFMTREAWKAFYLTRKGSQAEGDLNAYRRKNDPVEIAKRHNVRVERQTAMPQDGAPDSNTWLLEWREVAKGRDGAQVAASDWRMILSFVLSPPTDAETLRRNPHGIYVDSFHWEQIPPHPGWVAARGDGL